MSNTWYWGDLHLGHAGIIKFLDTSGKPIRPFKTIEEHDQALIDAHNAVVKSEDRVYFLGDVAINRRALPMLHAFRGRKKLVKGNHDIFKLDDYTPYFEDIAAYRIYPKHGIIMSHIPVHPCQLEKRFKYNVHGHMHSNRIEKDSRYLNICPEQTSFRPVSFDEILSLVGFKHDCQAEI